MFLLLLKSFQLNTLHIRSEPEQMSQMMQHATCLSPNALEYTPEAKEHAFALAHVNFVNENVICILSTNLFCPTKERVRKRARGGERQSKRIRWEAVWWILCITRIQSPIYPFVSRYECGWRISSFFFLFSICSLYRFAFSPVENEKW